MRSRNILPVVLCAVLAAGAYGQGAAPAAGSGAAQGTATAATPNQKVMAFVHEIETTLGNGDTDAYSKAFDVKALSDRTAVGMTVSDATRLEVEKGVQVGVTSLMTAMKENGKAGGRYVFLHLHTVKGELRAMFRMTGKTGLNYHDLCLRLDPGGVVRIVDIQVAVTGELFSQTLHRMFVPLVADANRGVIDRLAGVESDLLKHLTQVEALMTAINTKDFTTAHATYSALPASLQSDQTFMLYNAMALSHIDSAQYLEALEKFEKAFPDSPSLNLMRVDSTFLAKDWEGLIATLDKLEAQVGGDPYLAIFRVQGLDKKGMRKEAIAAGEKALRADPTIAENYVVVMQVLVEEKEWEGTRQMMERMLKGTGKFLATMTIEPRYGEYVKTAEFQQFQSDHPDLTFRPAN